MKNKTLIIIIFQFLIIVTLIWTVILVGSDEFFLDEDSDDDEEQIIIDYTTTLNGLTYVILPSVVEKNSGIEIETISTSNETSNSFIYGEVLNLSDLFEKKNDLLNLHRKKNKLNNILSGELDELSKLVALNKDNKNISDQVIIEKEGDIDILENDIEIIKNDIQNIFINTEHKWGNYFKNNIYLSKNIIAKEILGNQFRLVTITIPSYNLPKTMPKFINISIPNKTRKFKAEFISEAPSTNSSLQGKSFFYVVKNNELNIGARIKANLIQNVKDDEFTALFIPSSAVVWSIGKPWVYIKNINKEGHFLRRPLLDPLETNNGWVIKQDILKKGDSLVINGAQLLLSEEFKYQIKNENED